MVIRPRPGATTVAVPFGKGKRYRRYNPFVRTSRSKTTGVLLMLLSSGASHSRFGRVGAGDNAACADHIPRSAHILVCLRIPRGIGGRRRWSLRGGRVS